MDIRGTWTLRLALVAGALAVAALLAPRAWIEPLLRGEAQATPDAVAATGTIDPADFVFTDLAGASMPLADALADGPVLLDFWATWCAPCKKAMPAYAGVHASYADQGFQIWAVSWDRGRAVEKIAPYFEEEGFVFPAVLDPDQELGRALGVRSLPTTFLIAPDGTVAWKHVGYASGDEKELETKVRAVLGLGAD